MQIYEIGLSSLLVKDYFHKFIWREAHHELTTCLQVVLESLVEAILRMRALNSYEITTTVKHRILYTVRERQGKVNYHCLLYSPGAVPSTFLKALAK